MHASSWQIGILFILVLLCYCGLSWRRRRRRQDGDALYIPRSKLDPSHRTNALFRRY